MALCVKHVETQGPLASYGNTQHMVALVIIFVKHQNINIERLELMEIEKLRTNSNRNLPWKLAEPENPMVG